jgi:ParB family chromosome partitioning protein
MAQTPRPQAFSSGSFSGLRSALIGKARPEQEEGQEGAPLELPIDLVDPDPNQPRKHFPEEDLRHLADSMLVRVPGTEGPIGILQPIGVRKGEKGRWILSYGERRLRAAKIAGLTTVPAYEVRDDQSGLAAQIIENQHRADLSNSDMSRVIAAWTAEGLTNAQIATIANVGEQELKHYRTLQDLPEFLKPWCDRSSARALYEVAQAWRKAEGEVRGIIEERLENLRLDETLTLAEARRIIQAPNPRRGDPSPGDRTNGTARRLRPTEKIERLTNLVSQLLALIPPDRRGEASGLVETTLTELQIAANSSEPKPTV